MNEQRATLAIALMSALADGGKDGRERDCASERIAARLTGEGAPPAGPRHAGAVSATSSVHRVTVESRSSTQHGAQ